MFPEAVGWINTDKLFQHQRISPPYSILNILCMQDILSDNSSGKNRLASHEATLVQNSADRVTKSQELKILDISAKSGFDPHSHQLKHSSWHCLVTCDIALVSSSSWENQFWQNCKNSCWLTFYPWPSFVKQMRSYWQTSGCSDCHWLQQQQEHRNPVQPG